MGIKKSNRYYEKLICVCSGKDCKKRGAKKIFKNLKSTLKGRLLKGDILIIKTKCLDQCENAPVVIIDNGMAMKFSMEDTNSDELFK